ncbi:TAXI family TRAP transporter solute-binding subunit [Desulfobacula sp.]|uniref:TAXI family TRAP transporter solute-binding subunit n=1 Tax=Desulfobacula sp. TaxID=2593537 RepID=UPI00262960B8|nr:TAXI family TRAP transporter solute-binding subunit [Desulfobacula sp.]
MKKVLILTTALLFGAVLFLGTTVTQVQAKTTFVTIGTGGITGVYYPTGGAIAKIVNQKRKEYGIRCTVESTGGSVFNINAILAGDLDFGVAQSDRQYQAVKGVADWADKGPQKDLRAVFSIHAETVDLIAAVDANINSLADLKGKRVNIGNLGSGYRQNAIDALAANGINWETDFHAESLKAAEAPGLIQDSRIDAAFYTVGHPSGYYKEATSGTRKVKFVPILNIESLLEKYPYYAKAATLMKNYPGAANTEAAVPTFGVKATFVTSANVPDDVVYAITKEVFENFEQFTKLHPAYAGLTKEDMLTGLSAPIHSGAMKYYKEAGLK